MHFWLGLCAVISIGYYANLCVSAGCVWDVNKDIPFKDPVFFKMYDGRPRLVVPSSARGLHFRENEKINILCPGDSNYFNNVGHDELDVTCAVDQEVWDIGGARRRFLRDLECATLVAGDVRGTNRSCLNGKGRVFSIGYNSASGWMQLIEVCYNTIKNIALYSQHAVYGTAMPGAFVGNDRPSFKTNGISNQLPISKAYKKTHQTARFTKLLGKEQANTITQTKNFLSKGHLAPDADFIFHAWQRSTYFYINAVPQWQNINGGNWKKLESLIRRVANKRREDFKIWTGTHGVLEMKNNANEKVKLFLIDDDNLPVPRLMWKVVCNLNKHCIGFVVSNNPFTEFYDRVCNDICKETYWFQNGFDVLAKGWVSCCEVKDLKHAFTDIPKITVKKILNNDFLSLVKSYNERR